MTNDEAPNDRRNDEIRMTNDEVESAGSSFLLRHSFVPPRRIFDIGYFVIRHYCINRLFLNTANSTGSTCRRMASLA
jgi:hypothetical protein